MINTRRPLKKTADDSVAIAQPNAKRSRRKPHSALCLSALLSLVNLAAMTDQQHKHGHFSFIDTVDDPVVAHANSVAVGCSSQLATTRRPRIVSQGFDCFIKACLEFGITEPQQAELRNSSELLFAG
jgi:hypothetical protein